MRKGQMFALVLVVLVFMLCLNAQEQRKKRLLVIGMSADWQHESVSDAMATLYQLGRESGIWETVLRTDSQLLTKQPLERNAKNLDYFDAVFFMTTGELPMTPQQKADLLAFIRDDGKGFLGAHNATDTFYEWPEFGEMIGGYFDGHPWNQFEATVKVEDSSFPATTHFGSTFKLVDEIYQTRDFSRNRVRVLMSLDTSNVDMKKEGVKHTDIPITWVRQYGKGRVFYCGLGHRPEVWDRPDIRRMWTEAVRWVMGLTEGNATPRP